MPRNPQGNASRKITLMLGEAFREFLVLWVVILSQCLDLLPFATWARSFGLVGLCHCGGHPSACAARGCQGTSSRMRGMTSAQ